MAKSNEIILGVTGSIAAYKVCDIIRRLQDAGCHVTVIMTKGAERFISSLTLASLSGRKVYKDLFEEENGAWMNHIMLAQKASALLIAPATANIIGKISNGIADDLLSSLALATNAPIFMAPAMNDVMYKNKIVQENISKLKKIGVQFIDPIKGKLACGTNDIGHVADADSSVEAVLRCLKK